MREVAVGDVVFSFVGTKILAIGIAQSYCFECPKPLEFGTAGMNWENIGWKVRVNFVQLQNQVRPKDHMGILASLLPTKYSPLRPNGDGLQSVYLAEVPKPFAEVLAGLIGAEAGAMLHQAATLGLPADGQAAPHPTGDDLDYWEHRLEQAVVHDAAIPETEREAIVRSRRGQGLFKQRVLLHERRCRVTGVDRLPHLVASHCKPWRDSSNEERLDGENGLLLTPSIDHLFDRGPAVTDDQDVDCQLESRYFGTGFKIAFSRGNRKLKRQLDYALSKLSENGTMRELYLRYFPLGYY